MKIIDKALQVLNEGGIIGFPTDTVYGIGCDAFNPNAIEKIYKLKNRNHNKPLILFLRDKSELEKYAYVPTIGEKLTGKFWPGPLTIIFSAKPNCPIQLSPHLLSSLSLKPLNSSALDPLTIGIRIPNCESILTILKEYKNPLATTSANLEGTPPPKSGLNFNIKPDFIISGTVKSGLSSTIIDISGHSPAIIREGIIRRTELQTIIEQPL